MKKRIGILGGTFNPVHSGHISMADTALAEYDLDCVWLMPNYLPPHKELDVSNVTTADRICMLELAKEGHPGLEVNLFEIERKKTSYTWCTMELLDFTNPDTEFFFIIGADSLFQFHTWVHPERILKHCTLLVARREDREIEKFDEKIGELIEKYQATIYPLSMPLIHVSSTEVRKKLRQGRDVNAELPAGVVNYIKENGLYAY